MGNHPCGCCSTQFETSSMRARMAEKHLAERRRSPMRLLATFGISVLLVVAVVTDAGKSSTQFVQETTSKPILGGAAVLRVTSLCPFPEKEPLNLYISADWQHIAFIDSTVTGKDRLEWINFDGKVGPAYSHIIIRQINGYFMTLHKTGFSPSGKHFYYFAMKGQKPCFVVDGVEGPAPGLDAGKDHLCDIVFSPNDRSMASVTRANLTSACALVVHGKSVGFHGDLIPGTLMLTDDGVPAYLVSAPPDKNLTASASQPNVSMTKIAMVVGDKISQFIQLEPTTNMDVVHVGNQLDGGHYPGAVSPDGHRVAFVIVNGHPRPDLYLFENGEFRKVGPGRHPTFSPDGKRFAYVEKQAKGLDSIIIDGTPQTEPRYWGVLGLQFSPDSKTLAYAAYTGGNNRAMVVDGVEYPAARAGERSIYAPAGHRFAYATGFDEMIVDGKRVSHSCRIYDWHFSKDGTTFAYAVLDGPVLREDQPIGSFRGALNITLSDDGKHLAFLTRQVPGTQPTQGTSNEQSNNSLTVVLDGQAVGTASVRTAYARIENSTPSERWELRPLGFTPNGRHLISMLQSKDGKCTLQANGKKIITLDKLLTGFDPIDRSIGYGNDEYSAGTGSNGAQFGFGPTGNLLAFGVIDGKLVKVDLEFKD